MRRKRAGPSLEDLSSLIGDIHDAGVDGANWLAVLRRINSLVNGQMATVWIQGATEEFEDVRSMQQDHVRDYAEYYGSLDVLRPAVMRAPVGTIILNRMMAPPSEFVRTEFYNDFAKRYDLHDCMMARVFDGPSASGYIGLARSARVGVFERSDMRLLSLLLPHLRRAMQTRMRLVPTGIGPESVVEALDRLDQGVLIVDAEGRVAHANRAAEAIPATGDGLGIDPSGDRRHLRAVTPGQTRALRRLIAQAAAPRVEALSSCGGVLRLASDGEGSLLASVTPLRPAVAWNTAHRPAALILLSPADQDVSPRPEHLHVLYDLTPAEAAVAGRIMRGDGIQAAACALQITPNTVHTYLSRIFDKTGTRRQAELVRLLQQVARLK